MISLPARSVPRFSSSVMSISCRLLDPDRCRPTLSPLAVAPLPASRRCFAKPPRAGSSSTRTGSTGARCPSPQQRVHERHIDHARLVHHEKIAFEVGGKMFHGLSAFPITPADERGRVDTDALSALVQRLERGGVDSVGLLGSTGTYAYLSRAERGRAVEAAARCLEGRTPIIVGVGALRTDEAQDFARDAEAAGANGVLLAPVSYTPLTDEEVFQHFVAVAGATRLPVCIYNNPSTTHFTFSPDL